MSLPPSGKPSKSKKSVGDKSDIARAESNQPQSTVKTAKTAAKQPETLEPVAETSKSTPANKMAVKPKTSETTKSSPSSEAKSIPTTAKPDRNDATANQPHTGKTPKQCASRPGKNDAVAKQPETLSLTKMEADLTPKQPVSKGKKAVVRSTSCDVSAAETKTKIRGESEIPDSTSKKGKMIKSDKNDSAVCTSEMPILQLRQSSLEADCGATVDATLKRQMSSTPNKVLQKRLDDAKLSRVTPNIGEVNRITSSVLKCLKNGDSTGPRKWEIQTIGSFYDRTKVSIIQTDLTGIQLKTNNF